MKIKNLKRETETHTMALTPFKDGNGDFLLVPKQFRPRTEAAAESNHNATQDAYRS